MTEDSKRQADTPPSPANSSTTIATSPSSGAFGIDIPGYEILELLGRGGMGVVYKARQLRLKRLVALKMVRAGAHADERDLRRFRAEAEAVARLQHPNVVQIFDIADHNGLPYFAMEYADGGTLEQFVRNSPLAPAHAAELLRTLASAMHHAHGRGIIHRDLKPANVLMLADGTLKITDFGLAKILDEEQSLTPTAALLGTPGYMAPEQAAGKAKRVGPATDIHALGAILYKLLTGHAPFRGETVIDTLDKIRFEAPMPPRQVQPQVPQVLEAICLKCLAKQPEDRYRSAGELADELGRFLSNEPAVPTPRPLPPSASEPPHQVSTLSSVPVEEKTHDKTTWWAQWATQSGYDVLEETARREQTVACNVRLRSTGEVRILEATSGTPRMAKHLAKHAGHMQRLAQIVHPQLLRIFEVHLQPEGCCVVSERTEGDNLAQRIARELPHWRGAANVVKEMAGALHEAHRSGLVHRDVRPANVVWTADDMKLGGFDLAKFADEPEDEGTVVGTPSYMAPEQADGRVAEYGPATDVYGLGAMLYELLSGRPPFQAERLDDVLAQVRNRLPLPPRSLRPEIPEELERICLKCLAKQPVERYQSADALAEALHVFLKSAPVPTPVETRQEPPQPESEDGPRVAETLDLPGYVFEEQLGYNGLAWVYKARQQALDRLVVVKVFTHDVSRPNMVERVLAASRAVARLQHPNLVAILDCGQRRDQLYIVEEFVEGRTLEEHLAGRPQPALEAARVIESLARAAHFLHEHSIIHRDLEPRTIHVTNLGVPKIGSFAAAKLLGQSSHEGETFGMLVGTMLWMAPEQIAGDIKAIGPATDIYALGNLLYVLLTGKPPFPASTPLHLLRLIATQEPDPPRKLRRQIPEKLEAICLRCMRKEPQQRFATAAALADELQQFAAPSSVWQRVAGWFRGGR
jgi:serine/threonine protein kinase